MRRPRDTFRRNEDGSSSIEFVIVFPVIMWFVLTIFEMGLIATRMVMLEHGLDMAAREIRLGSPAVATHDVFRRIVSRSSASMPYAVPN